MARKKVCELFFCQVGTVPPAAAKGLKKGRGVGVAIGLGLNEADRGKLIRLFRA
jgi:hypothetical protein